MVNDRKSNKQQNELELLVAASDVVNCLIVLLNAKGRIIRINSASERISGINLTEARDKYFWEIFCHPEEVELYKAFFDSLDLSALPFRIETQLIQKDGKICSILWDYNYLKMPENTDTLYVLTGTDLTVHKQNIAALQETKEMYRALIHASPVAVIALDGNLKIKSWSSAAESLLGWPEKEVIGKNIGMFLDNDRQNVSGFALQALQGKSFYRIDHPCTCHNGERVDIEFSMAPLRNIRGEVNGLVMVASDITDRKMYEEKLEYFSVHDQLTGLFNRAYFDRELNRPGNEVSYPVTIIAADLDGLKLINDTLGHEHGNKMLLTCADIIKKSLRRTDLLAQVGGDEFAVILSNAGKEIGAVIVDRIKKSLEEYNSSNDDLPLSVSLGISTAEKGNVSLLELYREADDLMYIDKLHTGAGAKSQIIKSLMAALAERDFITAGHANRLEELCSMIGKKINLPQRQLGRLVLLAQVHDLGKVGIPDEILYKEGPLTDDEWKIMRKHPEKGHRIASASADLYGIADLILKHHERWDGSGYPLGLVGKEIPIECRILAIADAFDAMTNERPYRSARLIDEAVEEIQSCAGTQFDPELVTVFLSVLEESFIPKD